MQHNDTFISYAGEDNDFASQIAHGLISNGISVWFAPLSLKVGDSLLSSIGQGINESKTGILILSSYYLEKGWTTHEMDILVRQHIENKKKLLPIWLDVTKKQIDNKCPSLSGIYAITDTSSMAQVLPSLIKVLSENCPSRGIIPSWEKPGHRFLNGLGEVNIRTEEGGATTIFELLLFSDNAQFPFWLAGKTYTKSELLFHIAQLLGPVPDRVKNWVGEDGYKKLWNMCVEHDFDPKVFY